MFYLRSCIDVWFFFCQKTIEFTLAFNLEVVNLAANVLTLEIFFDNVLYSAQS